MTIFRCTEIGNISEGLTIDVTNGRIATVRHYDSNPYHKGWFSGADEP